MQTLKQAIDIAGPLGYPSKMPGTSYGISATKCLIGAKLAQIEGSTCSGCYALKGNYLYPSVEMAHKKRFAGLMHPGWVEAMVFMLLRAHKRRGFRGRNGAIKRGWHRWFDSGDLQGVWHLVNICKVARLTPKIRHWLPTRELKILQMYIAQGGEVPANLTIRVSATMVDGNATTAWPTTSGVHTEVAKGRACPAPKQGNNCGNCRACWSHKVSHVSYHLH